MWQKCQAGRRKWDLSFAWQFPRMNRLVGSAFVGQGIKTFEGVSECIVRDLEI